MAEGQAPEGTPAHTEKARELSSAIELVAAIGPALLSGEPVGALVGALGVGGKRLVDNYVLRRQRKLDGMIHDSLAALRDRIDEKVRVDEFVGLYIRSRETAARSERDEKLGFIRNFLVNSVVHPTSTEPDKERFARLLDDFSAPPKRSASHNSPPGRVMGS
jgi:hypothetical protein